MAMRSRLGLLLAALLGMAASHAEAAEPAAQPNLVNVDITQAPWSAVGRINNSAYGRCSAVLVRPDIALTAAHCLYNPASGRFLQPASIHVLFGFSKGRYGFHTTAADITIPKDYVPGGGAASAPHDWAILTLKQPVPAAFAPIAIEDAADPRPSSVQATGFGQRRSEVLTSTGPCAVLSGPEDRLLVTDCHLSHGYSGGPMIAMESGKLVGISVAASSNGVAAFGIAVPIAELAGRLPPDR